MKMIDFLKEKAVVLSVNIIGFIIVMCSMIISKVSIIFSDYKLMMV